MVSIAERVSKLNQKTILNQKKLGKRKPTVYVKTRISRQRTAAMALLNSRVCQGATLAVNLGAGLAQPRYINSAALHSFTKHGFLCNLTLLMGSVRPNHHNSRPRQAAIPSNEQPSTATN